METTGERAGNRDDHNEKAGMPQRQGADRPTFRHAPQRTWRGTTPGKQGWTVHQGDAGDTLRSVPAGTVDSIVTSPPYWWQRDYRTPGQIGQEPAMEEYIERIVSVMDQMAVALRPAGTLWLALGDTSYVGRGSHRDEEVKHRKRRFAQARATDAAGGLGRGIRQKSLLGIPYRIALRAIERGWVWRSTVLWRSRDRMLVRGNESPADRPATTVEPLLLMARTRHYWFDRDELLRRGLGDDIWTLHDYRGKTMLPTAPFPAALAEAAIAAGCPPGGLVMDPFAGSGTTGAAALASGRNTICGDISAPLCRRMAQRFCETGTQNSG